MCLHEFVWLCACGRERVSELVSGVEYSTVEGVNERECKGECG